MVTFKKIKQLKLNKMIYSKGGSKFNQVREDVMTIATEEEIQLVCSINGINVESLESIIYVRVGYKTYEQWMEFESNELLPKLNQQWWNNTQYNNKTK